MLLAIISIASVGCQDPAQRPSPANLLLVSIDTLRADHLDLYGYSRRTAPNLRRLANEATVFENAYSQAPKTAPSHMTLLTGLYPAAHGVQNLSGSEAVALSPSVPTLAQLLDDAGFRNLAHTGGGHVSGVLGFDRGFERFFEGGNDWWIFSHVGSLVEELDPGDAPFFAFVHTYQVHDPYVPPRRFQIFNDLGYGGEIVGDLEQLRTLAGDDWSLQHDIFWRQVRPEAPADLRRLVDLYDASILYTDVLLANLLDRLKRAGLYESTLIIVLSDHGEEFLDHGGFLHETLYEEILRVPLIIRLPHGSGEAWRGRRIVDRVRLVDVLPTILEYFGLPTPSHVQGASFLGLIDTAASGRERPVLAHWLRDGEKHPISIRLDDWKLIEHGRRPTAELFDLAADPEELHDLAAARPEVARRLRELRQRMVEESMELRALHDKGSSVEISPDLERQLRALGYLR